MRAHDNQVGLLPVGLGHRRGRCVDDRAGDWHADAPFNSKKPLQLQRQLVAIAAGERERLDSAWFEIGRPVLP